MGYLWRWLSDVAKFLGTINALKPTWNIQEFIDDTVRHKPRKVKRYSFGFSKFPERLVNVAVKPDRASR